LQSDEPGWALEDADRAFHDTLISWLTFHKAVLIGELIPLALQYLRDNPACPERHTFEHVLVDEYQDLNKAEQVLIDILAEPCNHLIVGDADQSIYSFRFAHPEGITNFGDTHPGTHDEILTDCRRCPTVVVELADHLIRANYPAEEPRRLNTFEGNPVGQVAIVQWQRMQEEAEGITEFCQYLANHAGYEPQDILILCPRRLIGYGIRDALRNSGIAAHSYYYEEAFEPTEAQINFCLLSINCNNDDRVALRYWLGSGSNSWNARGYKILREHCEMTDHSTYQTMQELMAGDLQLPYTKPLIERFSLLQDELAALIDLRGYELLDRLFPEGQEWCNVLRDAALARIDEETEPQDLLDLLRTQITQPEMPEEGDFARVMSLHKSKGLTSRVVIVAGCIEGLCPTYADNLDQVGLDAAIKEQRRLFFVAITRCQEILVLSSVIALEKRIAYKMGAQVRGRGLVGSTIATRFINDLGPTAPRPITGARWIANGFQ
jgi:superfamily I DNA/RNA helicase